MYTAYKSENASSGRLQELKNNGKSLNFQAQKVVAVAYGRWSFTRGSNCKALTRKVLVFWTGGLLWEVVAHGGSTVPSTDVIHLTLTLQMITARHPMSMQQSYLVLRQPSDDHVHPTYRST